MVSTPSLMFSFILHSFSAKVPSPVQTVAKSPRKVATSPLVPAHSPVENRVPSPSPNRMRTPSPVEEPPQTSCEAVTAEAVLPSPCDDDIKEDAKVSILHVLVVSLVFTSSQIS